MKQLLGFVFSVFFISTSRADTFRRFDELLPKTKRQEWQHRRDATTRMKFLPGLDCTGVFVGPTGEALTNLHCVEQCIEASGAFTSLDVAVAPGLKAFNLNNDDMKNVSCQVQIENKYESKKLNVEILHVLGPGWLAPRTVLNDFLNANPVDYISYVNQGYEGAGDAVLIRIKEANNTTCAKLGDLDFNAATPADVVNIAFPIVYRKIDDNPIGGYLLTLGTSPLWTEGQASGNQSTLKTVLSPALQTVVDVLAPNPNILVASLDAEPGSSGSPIFSAQDKSLVGLMRSVWKAEGNFIPWTGGALSLAPHKALIQSLVPENQNCQ